MEEVTSLWRVLCVAWMDYGADYLVEDMNLWGYDNTSTPSSLERIISPVHLLKIGTLQASLLV